MPPPSGSRCRPARGPRVTFVRLAALAALAIVGGTLLATANASGQPSDVDLGRRVYQANCAVCHGEGGDGQGHAAHHFRTAPRDFTSGRYKIRSTPSGQPPTDDDLRRTVVVGLPGTGMVPHDHLSDAEVDAVIALIKSLSPKFATTTPPSSLPMPSPPPRDAAAVAHGRKVYEKAECYECHGREGRGDGPSAKDLKVKPADLTRRPFKSGPTPRDLVRTFITGLDGTSMPSYHLILEDDELWDLAYYVDSIGGPPETTGDEAAGWHVVRMHQKRAR